VPNSPPGALSDVAPRDEGVPSGWTFRPRLRARRTRRDWSTAHPSVSIPVPMRERGGWGVGAMPVWGRGGGAGAPWCESATLVILDDSPRRHHARARVYRRR
jgi:hypothetical protein